MNIVYLSYTGLLEPLGQSQVLAYLRRLAARHRITLITYEKAADLSNMEAVAEMQSVCRARGITWIARRYHQRPRLLATAWDLATFLWTALRAVRRSDADLIHARSYIPGFVALAVKRLAGVPFIFDMRAFWPEEMVTAGRLRANSRLYNLLKEGERVCLREAAVVVSLTNAAVVHMTAGGSAPRARFVVIPTCVDLDRFVPSAERSKAGGGARRIGSTGTILSGWFHLDWLMAFFCAARDADQSLELEILTRDDAARVAAAAEGAGVRRVSIYRKTSEEMPAATGRLDAVAMFFTGGVAKMASCPTRMGEVLACGVPVVANPGVGDVADIIRRYRVGVLVEDASASSMATAFATLCDLFADADLSRRCRAAAEDWFSLAKGVAAYDGIYESVGSRGMKQSGRTHRS